MFKPPVQQLLQAMPWQRAFSVKISKNVERAFNLQIQFCLGNFSYVSLRTSSGPLVNPLLQGHQLCFYWILTIHGPDLLSSLL